MEIRKLINHLTNKFFKPIKHWLFLLLVQLLVISNILICFIFIFVVEDLYSNFLYLKVFKFTPPIQRQCMKPSSKKLIFKINMAMFFLQSCTTNAKLNP